VFAHVQGQFAQYGPLSIEHEYFGFIYRFNEHIDSAVTRSSKCLRGNCFTDTAQALSLIPRGSRVLGEWHTHPRDGSVQLSAEDVRGARHNRHIRCYVPFYSGPDGRIFSWEPASTSVPVAMASRLAIGSYAAQPDTKAGKGRRPGDPIQGRPRPARFQVN
jgi:hypothetical protein